MTPHAARVIRDAVADDWRWVAALLAELGRPDVRGTPDEVAGQEGFERYLQRDDAVALVAEVDGQVVGFVDVEFRHWLTFTAPQAWIPDLIVAEAGRGQGTGAALLARVEEIARDRRCWAMTLESATWRERAHRFYASNGWKDTGKSFTRVLTDVEWPPKPRQ